MTHITTGLETVKFESCKVSQVELTKLKNAKKAVSKLRRSGYFAEAQTIVAEVRKNSDEYYKYRIQINGKNVVFGLNKETALKVVKRINYLVNSNVKVIDLKRVVDDCVNNRVKAADNNRMLIGGEFDKILNEIYASQTEY